VIFLEKCLVCDSHDYSVVQKQTGPDTYLELLLQDHEALERFWIRCLGCGLIRQKSILDTAETKKLYLLFRDRTIRPENPDEYFDRISSLPADESENYQRCVWLNNEIPRAGKILDIGCGGGVFLHQFKGFFGQGWEVTGIEPTVEYAELAARRLSAKIESGMFDEYSFVGNSFDLITINHVLEHVIDPIEFLHLAQKLLKPNGMIFIETPEQSDFEFLPETHDRFSLQHNWYFRLFDLECIGSQVGLKPVKGENFISLRTRNNARLLLKKQ
jgi:SAM-dependent methyltransferase